MHTMRDVHALRRQLQELQKEENAKQKAAARAEAEIIGRNPFNVLGKSFG